MTQPQTAFGATAVAEPPAPFLPADGEGAGSSPDNRRKLAIVGGLVAVLVVAGAAFFLTRGHGSSNGNGNFVVPHGQVRHAAAAGHSVAPIKLPKQVKQPDGRDPFKPLYTPPAPAKAAAPTGTTAPSTGAVTTVSSSTTSPTTAAPATFAPVWIELASVSGTQSATFVVGYSNGHSTKTVEYANVKAPTNSLRTDFASVFALLSIQDGTATVQFGDGSPFDLFPGAANRHNVG
jgi:hypothetical protein